MNEEQQKLSATQIEIIEQSERVAISVVSCFEVAQIVKKGRLILPLPTREWIKQSLVPAGIEVLPLSPEISCQAVDLTDIHKDPFDRLIIATALDYQCRLTRSYDFQDGQDVRAIEKSVCPVQNRLRSGA